ncbi:MAG: SDR family oxidoreductase [Formivibrio sp.]|nr:SDR family oxidoreductase [Formivibrio sp.]
MKKNRVLVTGANGFVGRGVCSELTRREYDIHCAVRNTLDPYAVNCKLFKLSDIGSATDWSGALDAVDFVVHLAARVYVMQDKSTDPLTAFRQVNVAGTLNLARQASAAGVQRFIFISSIKVNGDITLPGEKFHADDIPAPQDPYGISKYEAENALRELGAETGMEVVIIRPPLVYGPGVKANFLSMMCWLHKGIPLPLGAIHNQRSLVSLDNLVDLIMTCINHPKAANQTFLVSDAEDISTTQLLRRMANALNVRAKLLPVPQWILATSFAILNKNNFTQRLSGSLQVDITKTRNLLEWVPPFSVDAGLMKVAHSHLDSISH